MSIKIGNTDINKRYLGGTEIKKVYLGSNIIFESAFFTSLWETTTPNENITLPYLGGNVTDWGDGTINSLNSHIYANIGQYTIKISGVILGFAFNNLGDKDKILNISSFGGFQLISGAFRGCSNLDITATDTPLINGNSIMDTFRNCPALLYNSSINLLDVSNVVNTSLSFIDSTQFNQDISGWNTSNFEDISLMFGRSSFNQSLNSWDLSSLLDCESMFINNTAFNQEINWNTPLCENFTALLYGATGYDKPVTLNTTSATSLRRFLFINSTFNQPLNFSNTSNVTNFSAMFQGARAFNQPLNFDTSSADNMEQMFREARDFNQPLNGWDFSNVTDMSDFMRSKSIYNINYMDDLYIKLDQDLVFANMVNVNISFGTINYSSNGAAARASLVSKGFIITSGGQV